MVNFPVIFVTFGLLLIPACYSMIFRMNYNMKMGPKSPHIVLVGLFDKVNYRISETRNGFIVNETMILSWGQMSPGLLMVGHANYRRSIPSIREVWEEDDGEIKGQVIEVKGVKSHPCLPELSLIELKKPLVFNQHFQPTWFHADYQNEIEQNVQKAWIDGWSWVKKVQKKKKEFFIDFQRLEVDSILKCSPEDFNQTYFTACTTSYGSNKVKYGNSKKSDEHNCLYPGAGLLVQEIGQNASYLAGIAYPQPNHTFKPDSHSNKPNCPIDLKFLDLTKMLCWISGSEEFSSNCTNIEGFEEKCEISDINANWSLEDLNLQAEFESELKKILYSRKFIFLWFIFIFILTCTLIYIIFRTRICK